MVNFGGFFAKLGQFAGFSLNILKNVLRISEAAMGGKGDITFSARFFLYIIRRTNQRSCDGQDWGLGTYVI